MKTKITGIGKVSVKQPEMIKMMKEPMPIMSKATMKMTAPKIGPGTGAPGLPEMGKEMSGHPAYKRGVIKG